MQQVAILVSSYDRLSDCWAPFCHGLSKYWPDCTYPAYLIVNHKDFSHQRVETIKVGDDRGWSSNLLYALDRIDARYIMYFQEDYWICERVNSQAIDEYVSAMDRHGINYLRLLSFPRPDEDFAGDDRLGVLADTAEYRTAVQITIWRKEVLQELIDPKESPWEFETRGTVRSRKYGDTFLSVKAYGDDPYYYGIRYVCTAINQGRWARAAKQYAEQEGLAIDFGNLPSETWWHEYKRQSRVGAFLGLWAYRTQLVFSEPGVALAKLRRRLNIQ